MIERQSDGSFKIIWFDVPVGEKCWTGGISAINGKCIFCGHKTEDHQRETTIPDKEPSLD